jgi:hypothetical protein
MALTHSKSFALLFATAVSALACVPRGDPALDGVLVEDFNRTELGTLWRNTGGPYVLLDGQLKVKGARNKPLWLRRTLPRDVLIEFDVRSESPSGDIKVEVYGDGTSKAEQLSYNATSYVVIFGGWGNTLNVIARMDEHAEDRAVGTSKKVEQGHTYRMKIERKGDTISSWADGHLLAKMKDPNPLWGPGHDHFAFNDWDAELWFDNLKITPL